MTEEMVAITLQEYNDLVDGQNQLKGEFTPIGWIPPEGGMSIEDFIFNMESVNLLHRAGNCWLGDHLNYGEYAYGEKYAQALPAPYSGYNLDSIRNIASVCRRVPISLRNDSVSWSHLVAVAPYEHDVIERLLDMTVRHRWTVRQLYAFVKRWHRMFGDIPVRTGGRSIPDGKGPTASLPLYTIVRDDVLDRYPSAKPAAVKDMAEFVVTQIERYLPAPVGQINMVKHARRVMKYRRLARTAWNEVDGLRDTIEALKQENDALYDQIVELQSSRLEKIAATDDDWQARIMIE